MKVLHVIDALGLGGGAEHSLAAILPALRKRGVRSVVACLKARHGGLQQHLREQGFPVVVLPGRFGAARVAALRQLIRAEQPDLVHATLFHACLASRLAAAGLGIPRVNSLVNTSYDPVRPRLLGVPRWKLWGMRLVDGITARAGVDRFHAISETVKTSAVETLGLDPCRVTVIPRGRSEEVLGRPGARRRAVARRALDLAPDRPVLLTVGRQDPQKGHAYLVRALPELLRHRSDALLLVVGREGGATPELHAALEETGVGAAVRLLGHRVDVPELLAASDLFVFPSLYEGLGCAALEAMALAVPVVAWDIPIMQEVLGGGEAGILVPPLDVDALASALVSALDDREAMRRLGEGGRARFLSRFTLDRVADQTVALYREVTTGPTDPDTEGGE